MDKSLIIFNLDQSKKRIPRLGLRENFQLRYLLPLFIKFLTRMGYENTSLTDAVRKNKGKYFVFSCDIYETTTISFIKKFTRHQNLPICYFIVLSTLDEAYKAEQSLAKPFSVAPNLRSLIFDNNEVGLIGADETNMTTLSQAAQCERLASSIKNFEEELGVSPIPIYSYPQGAYDVDLINALKSFGFRAAVCNASGINDASSDPFQLRRVFFDPFSSMSYIKIIYRLLKLRNKRLVKTNKTELKGEILNI
ncbi:MAG: polysaccharide deacetylase family protein [Oligoflexales bacterium]|nr:polysaccharide deacetylase family protein [Oligoflexales bacterium]